MRIKRIIVLLFIAASVVPCRSSNDKQINAYPNIIDISKTPCIGTDIGPMLHGRIFHIGLFCDQGSWMGFVPPSMEKPMCGFCGPFSISHRYWFAQSLATVKSVKGKTITFYYPGQLQLEQGGVNQALIFANSSTAIIRINNHTGRSIAFGSIGVNDNVILKHESGQLIFTHPCGESLSLSFSTDVNLNISGNEYTAETNAKELYVCVTFHTESSSIQKDATSIDYVSTYNSNVARWNGYISKIIRDSMPADYNRVAVKALVTLVSNWRVPRDGLKHQAIVPSHSSDYFVGWWSWDCWRFSTAIASVLPQLAKDNIRAIFDYQLSDGMVPDCIHLDSNKNNLRDTKPPLCAWAVYEVYRKTSDIAFVREMYPKLLNYYKWWFKNRDHDHNGICEFGSCDGTLEAAAWESGMDNAIRFDGCEMLNNAPGAWSLNQESVDLNSYLVNEYTYLKKLATIIGEKNSMPDMRKKVANYFFDKNMGFFCDRRISSKMFIEQPGCEGYTPLWTGVASNKQFKKVLKLLLNPTKFSTYIPFPTVAADNPKYDPTGYWRGPIWLDQTYFAISGLRRYGEKALADKYTSQVFTRLHGLTGSEPIYENYDTNTGAGVAEQSNQFSWSAAHLLMMYEEYNK